MPRYIDADNAKEIYLSKSASEQLDRVPTADVQEVIYCKNCKNYCKFENGAVVCEEFGGYIKDTDFCSRGAKMDGDKK